MAIHEPTLSYRKVTASSDRKFGIVLVVVFVVIALVPLTWGGSMRWWALGIGVCFFACAFLVPQWMRPLNERWLKFGRVLHRLINPIAMGALYFCAFVPMGLALRAMGKDPLRLERDNISASYWITREPPGPAPGSMSKQF